MTEATFYERRTYEGRLICESREGGYCGSCPLETHVKQMRDPTSWVHSSKDRWHDAALQTGGREMVAGDL